MQSRVKRFLKSVAATVGVAATIVLGGVSPASATAASTCPYPYVCLYNHFNEDQNYFYRYQVVTDYYQVPPVRTGLFMVVNTRHDDVVHIRYTDSGTTRNHCLEPGWNFAGSGTITGIRISSAATC